MAEITKSTYATDVKDVKYNGTADRAFWNRKEVMRMVRNGNIVFNRAFFELICDDELSLTAVGSREQPLHDVLDPVSRKTDCDGTTVEVEFEGAEDVIVPNETEEEKSGTYTIRQKVSNLEITGRWKQEAAKVEKYEFLYVDRASVVYDDNIRAGGSTVDPRITVYYMLKEILSSGVNREKLYSNAGYATDAAGAPLNSSGATIDDDGGVHAGSLERNETNEREVFAVNEMAGTVYISQTGETKPWEWTGSVFVYQNQNKPNYGTPYYSIWSDVTPDSLDAATESAQVEISAWLLTDIVWSSGAEDQDSERTTVYLEPSVGTLSSTSASGNATITWSGLRNTTGVDRTVSLRIYHGSAGVYDKTYSLPQSGAEFSKWIYWKIQSVSAGYDRIPAGGGTVTPYVSVTVIYYAEYTDGTAHYDETKNKTYSGVSVSAATAPNAPSIAGVTFNSKTGAVYAPSLGHVETPETEVFYVGSLSGSFVEDLSDVTVEWSWDGGAYVGQAENYKRKTGETAYTFNSEISPETLEGSDTVISVSYNAWYHEYYYWDSAPSKIISDDTAQWMYIRITGDATASKDVKGSGTYTYDVGKATSDRSFKVTVTNDFGYKDELDITQIARVFSHYRFGGVSSVGVSYDEVGANGGDSYPSISIRAYFYAVYSDGTEDSAPVYDNDIKSVTVVSASGYADNSSGATVNNSTGVVTVGRVPKVETPERNVFNVTGMAGTFASSLTGKSHDWNWTGTAGVTQMENVYELVSGPTKTLKSSVSSTSLEAVDTTITVTGTAVETSYYAWSSYPEQAYWEKSTKNLVLYVMNNRDTSDVKHIVGTDVSVTFDVGVNTSTTTQRTFLIEVYDADGDYSESYYITQKVNSYSEWWTTPVLNGSIVMEDILADGTGQPVLVPIKQYKYGGTEGSSGATLLETYTASVLATAVGGSAVSGTGASFSGGEISASNLGTSATSRRKVYTLTSVTVPGKDKSHTIPLSSSVAVYQEANVEKWVIVDTLISFSPTSKAITYASQTVAFTLYANDYGRYEYTSGSKTDTQMTSATGTLSVSGPDGATLSSSSFSANENGKGYTLSVTENVRDVSKTFTVTAKASSGLRTSTFPVTQGAASFVLTAGSDKECNATASTVYVTFTSSRNGKVWEPAFTTNNADATINKSGITLSGTTYTVPVAIKANSSSSNRDIIVTATQSRYSGDVTATVTITQAGAAQNLPLAGVVLNECMYTSDTLASVSYSLYFTASPSSSYQGGTLSNVVIQLNTAANGSGSVLASRTIGNVTVSRGSNSSTYSGTLNSGGRVAYLLVYWGGSLQFATEVEEYVPEG